MTNTYKSYKLNISNLDISHNKIPSYVNTYKGIIDILINQLERQYLSDNTYKHYKKNISYLDISHKKIASYVNTYKGIIDILINKLERQYLLDNTCAFPFLFL